MKTTHSLLAMAIASAAPPTAKSATTMYCEYHDTAPAMRGLCQIDDDNPEGGGTTTSNSDDTLVEKPDSSDQPGAVQAKAAGDESQQQGDEPPAGKPEGSDDTADTERQET